MFVYDAPLSVLLAQTHSEPKIKLSVAVLPFARASPNGGRESDIRSSNDLQITEIENHWPD
jgi:hypothetical protein